MDQVPATGRAIALILLCCVAAATSWQAAHAADEITEEQVYTQTELLTLELERIRSYMGVQSPPSRTFRMSGAQPRHVFFQTQIAFRRCNLLAQQLTGISRVSAPVAPEGDPSLADVSAILGATRNQLDIIEETLEATAPLPDAPRIRNRDISGAMVRIVEANLLLHELTGFKADWADIWDQLIQIMTYVGGALPEESRYPALEAYTPQKSIADVAALLLSIRRAAAPASESVGITEVRTIITNPAEGGSSAEGLSDLTTTYLYDLAEVTHRLGAQDVDPPTYERPVRVFPSHVFQLAKALLIQVEAMSVQYENQAGGANTTP